MVDFPVMLVGWRGYRYLQPGRIVSPNSCANMQSMQLWNLGSLNKRWAWLISPQNTGLIRPYEGKPMVNKPLIRPY